MSFIAGWDGAEWIPFGAGAGMNASVCAFASYNGRLIAGGAFTLAGGRPCNFIAVWNGSGWEPLGAGLNGEVRALAVYDGYLIAGGLFTLAGGAPADYVAAWDGQQWTPLGEGVGGC